MRAVSKVISYIIPIIVLVLLLLYFYGGTGALTKLKDDILDVAPNISIGADENIASAPTIPQEHSNQITSLQETIQKMIESDETECFAQFKDFSDLGKDERDQKGTSIEMTYANKKTQFIVRGGAGGGQKIDQHLFSIDKMKPCVIAGKDEKQVIAENFFLKFLKNKTVTGPFHNTVNGITISYGWVREGIFRVCNKGNRITVTDFDEGPPVNNWCDNYLSEGYLFKVKEGDENNICFFPTNYHRNNNKNGIAEEWFSKRSKSIQNRISEGKLTKCY